MHRFRPASAWIAVTCAIGLMPTDVRAQLFRKPARAQNQSTANADADSAGTATRGARQNLRNGIDYLDKYGDPSRALNYLKQAKKQQADLSADEQKTLDASIAHAQRIIAGVDAARLPVARNAPQTNQAPTTRDGVLNKNQNKADASALAARPVKSDRLIQTTSADRATLDTSASTPIAEPEELIMPSLPSVAESSTASSQETPAPAATEPAINPPSSLELTILSETEDSADSLNETANAKIAPVLKAAAALPALAAPAESDPLSIQKNSVALKSAASTVEDVIESLPMAPSQVPTADLPAMGSGLSDSAQIQLTSQLAEPVLAAGLEDDISDDKNIPEIGVTPIDASGSGNLKPSDIRMEKISASSPRPLLVPPAAPRPVQQLEGVKVDENVGGGPAELVLPTLPGEPATAKEPAPLPLAVTTDSDPDLDSVNSLNPVVISRANPVSSPSIKDPGSLEESAQIPPAPAAAAEELLNSARSESTGKLPELPEPPAALPQPTNPIGAMGEQDPALPQLPPSPGSEGEATPTAEGDSTQLPDPIPGASRVDIPVRNRDTLREIEELARRQTAESRMAAEGNLGSSNAGTRREDATADLPRAPAPTEARPIKPIEIPEEFIPLEKRNFEVRRKFWASPAICHTPLYFQDVVLERYGQGVEQALGPHWGQFFSYPLDDPRQSIQRQQMLQPAYSAGMFALQILALPYNILMDPPWEAQYDLGYYRPGDPIPPDTTYLPTTGVGPPLRGRKY